MHRKIIVSTVFLLTIIFPPLYAQHHTGKAKPIKKPVLIVKDSSDLETAVSRILGDSLSKLGYKVKEVGLTGIGDENASFYKVSIVFSAIGTGDDIDPDIQKFIASGTGTSSNVFLYTVYGKVYQKQDKNVDATTEASKELHPQMIANHILHSLKLK